MKEKVDLIYITNFNNKEILLNHIRKKQKNAGRILLFLGFLCQLVPLILLKLMKIRWKSTCSFAQSTASLQSAKTPYSNECPRYDIKQSDGEVPVMLELWRMQSTLLLLSHPGPLWPWMVAPDKDPIFGSNRTKSWFLEFTIFAFKLRIYAKLNCLK